MSEAVAPFDLVRMFFGEQPALFYLEIVVRTCVVYSYAFLLIRWVGGRGIAQMSTVEFLLVIALGSAVGDAMFYPDVPILHSLAVITIVILANKLLDIVLSRSVPAEKVIGGRAAEIVRNGIICRNEMRRLNLGQSELHEALRENGIRNLGEVEHAYLESSGKFSVFKSEAPKPGLAIVPAWDVDPPDTFGASMEVPAEVRPVCCLCGQPVDPAADRLPPECSHCGAGQWTRSEPGEDPK